MIDLHCNGQCYATQEDDTTWLMSDHAQARIITFDSLCDAVWEGEE